MCAFSSNCRSAEWEQGGEFNTTNAKEDKKKALKAMENEDQILNTYNVYLEQEAMTSFLTYLRIKFRWIIAIYRCKRSKIWVPCSYQLIFSRKRGWWLQWFEDEIWWFRLKNRIEIRIFELSQQKLPRILKESTWLPEIDGGTISGSMPSNRTPFPL